MAGITLRRGSDISCRVTTRTGNCGVHSRERKICEVVVERRWLPRRRAVALGAIGRESGMRGIVCLRVVSLVAGHALGSSARIPS